jgi:hypothetical protein
MCVQAAARASSGAVWPLAAMTRKMTVDAVVVELESIQALLNSDMKPTVRAIISEKQMRRFITSFGFDAKCFSFRREALDRSGIEHELRRSPQGLGYRAAVQHNAQWHRREKGATEMGQFPVALARGCRRRHA